MTSRRKDGVLVIIGGGEDREGEMTILREFVRLSGGKKSRIVLLPIATADPLKQEREYRRVFERIGVGEFRMLLPADRCDAEGSECVPALDHATGVFFPGGEQKKLRDLLTETGLDEVIRRRYSEGMVVGGTSAGASMMADVMMADGESEECAMVGTARLGPGVGLLRGVVIDQHFGQRGRHGRLLAAISERPDCLGLGIGEDTAMIVEGDQFTAMGRGAVTVLDPASVVYNDRPTRHEGEPITLAGVTLHTLSSGARYDLKSRALLPRDDAPRPDGRPSRVAERTA